MRSYTVAITALVIDAPAKWVDNLLSQHPVPEILSFNRGIARRVPYSALVRLAIVRQLHDQLGLGVANALRIAGQLIGAKSDVYESGQLRLVVDRVALERHLNSRLVEVLESAPTTTRGRPS